MKFMSAAFLSVVALSATAQAQPVVVVDPRPTVDCIEYVRKETTKDITRFEAAVMCKDGVTVDCMQKLKADEPGITRSEAALACQGSPSVECVKYLKTYAFQPLREVMKVCAGRSLDQ